MPKSNIYDQAKIKYMCVSGFPTYLDLAPLPEIQTKRNLFILNFSVLIEQTTEKNLMFAHAKTLY